jgi:hypothetical protein
MTIVFQSLDGLQNYNPDFGATIALRREVEWN